jgi:hypothetical protein
MIGARGLWAACLTLVLSAVSGSGCATRQSLQDDPVNHRRDVGHLRILSGIAKKRWMS